jgi:G patch domain-containing protein 1
VEGFQPSTFTSSRTNRIEQKVKTAQDFMDDDDGLLGEELKSKKEFDTFGQQDKLLVSKLANEGALGSSIPGPMPGELFGRPSKSIGTILLSKMGWKEGQGIGARKQRKQFSHSIHVSQYHQGADKSIISSGILSEGEITFAPINVVNLYPIPPRKYDFCGIGYDSSIMNPELTASRKAMGNNNIGNSGSYHMNSLFDKTVSSNINSNNLQQQKNVSGFAVDDDYDDVYDNTSISLNSNIHVVEEVLIDDDDDNNNNYRLKSKSKSEVLSNVNSWLATASKTVSICPSDGKPTLPGFVLSTKIPQIVSSFYAPPDPPKSFNGKHVFIGTETDVNGKEINSTSMKYNYSPSSSKWRGNIMDEKVVDSVKSEVKMVDSMFDLMDDNEKDKLNKILESARNRNRKFPPSPIGPALHIQQPPLPIQPPEPKLPPLQPPEPQVKEEILQNARPMLVNANMLQSSVFLNLSKSFKNRFESIDAEVDSKPVITEGGLMEYNKLETDVNKNGNIEGKKIEVTSITKPIKLVNNRVTSIWIPIPLLCKRFNIAVPDIAKNISSVPRINLKGSREDEIFNHHINSHFNDISGKITETLMPNLEEKAINVSVEDEEVEKILEKPSMSFFKSIFENSDSSSISSDNDDGDDDDEINNNINIDNNSMKTNLLNEIKEINNIEDNKACIDKVIFQKPSHKRDDLSHVTNLKKKREKEKNNRLSFVSSNKKLKTSVISFNMNDEDEDDSNDKSFVTSFLPSSTIINKVASSNIIKETSSGLPNTDLYNNNNNKSMTIFKESKKNKHKKDKRKKDKKEKKRKHKIKKMKKEISSDSSSDNSSGCE